MLRSRALLPTLVIASAAVACNALLAIDNYRACVGAECGDASTDGGAADGAADGGVACMTSGDCVNADAGLVCSQNRCASVVKLARGMSNYECAVLSDKTARCWGRNAEGQLGNGKTSVTNVEKPQTVLDVNGSTMTDIETISLGYGYACALTLTAGNTAVWCWGTDLAGGLLTVPTQVSLGNHVVVQLSAGSVAACALLETGEVDCWGQNKGGEMSCTNTGCNYADGGGPQPPTATLKLPRRLASNNNPAFIATGLYAFCAGYKASGFIDCWGNDIWGNLGDGLSFPADTCCGTSNPSPNIGAVSGEQTEDLQAGDFYTCAQGNSQHWYCWGGNLGEGCALLNGCGDLHAPTRLDIGYPILALGVGWRHMCAILTGGSLTCWGDNQYGEMGTGVSSSTSVSPPVKSHVPVPVTEVAAHRGFTCAIGSDGQVYCWGFNGDPNGDTTPWLLGVGSPKGSVLTPGQVVWE